MAKLVLVDDHVLLRNGLAELVKNLGHAVLFESSNGSELINTLQPGSLPDVVLMDINMPVMDGYEATKWLRTNHPGIKVLALSMYDTETAIIRMLKNGAKGYILKDSEPSELNKAVETIVQEGFYYSELVDGKFVNAVNNMTEAEADPLLSVNDREKAFLQMVCTEMTYKEIAEKMFVSHRTVDGYRDSLFDKLKVKTRVGLVLYAIRHRVVDVV